MSTAVHNTKQFIKYAIKTTRSSLMRFYPAKIYGINYELIMGFADVF